jgi:chromosome segregation protein
VHLSAIKLRGFKSFPDPIEIRLEPGVGVIVGPNGSGKSNVSDAIVWAAGSLSPHELRAEKPDDVLFAGSATRPASDHAQVELVFDNADGTGPVEFSELSIARRLHRGGEGQYLVNGAHVRRIDLVELLADLGLGGSMHSVIGQGKVEEILGASAERRRELVEEAAGLGRFKRQRHRAELKLARVAVQVERARDIEEEVRKRLRPLALQATAAERAEKLLGEIARLRARVATLDLEGAQVRLDEAQERKAAAVAARRRTDERLEAVLAQRHAAEEELADAAGGREAATAALYRVRNAGERVAMRRESADALASALRAELSESETEDTGPTPELRRLEREAAEAAGAAGAAAAERDRAVREAAGAHARVASLDRAARAAAEERLAAALDGRAALEAAAQEAGAARERATDGAYRLRGAVERLALRREALLGVLEAARAELAQAEGADGPDPAKLERDAGQALAAARSARVEADGLAAQAEGARERLTALERSLAEREGLPPAARALAEQGERLALSLVDVEPGQERAVAAALGWRAGALVAADPAAALALLERARAAGLGALSVVVGERAAEVVRDAKVVPAEELLQTDVRAVTPEGHGYDPATGELWFAGETAEAVLLELDARRRALATEVRELDAAAARAAARAEEAEAAAAVAAEAFAPFAHFAGRRRLDAAALSRLVAVAERAEAAVAGAAPALEAPLAAAAEQARARAEELAAELRRVAADEGDARRAAREAAERIAAAELRLARLGVEAVQTALDVEADEALLRSTAERLAVTADDAVARAAEASARARAAQDALTVALPPTRRRDAVVLRRALAVTDRLDGALLAAAALATRAEAPLKARVDAGSVRATELAGQLRTLAGQEAELRREAASAAERAAAVDVELARIDADADDARRRLAEADAEPAEGDDREELAARVERLEARRIHLGQVNPLAKEEYEAEKGRLEELAVQRADLEASLAELEKLRAELTETVERRFEATFAAVAAHFEEVAGTLFPGGEGRLRLTTQDDEADSVAAGIEIELRPAGKKITRLSLLSGGEKSLGAISFVFALFLARPCPFYLLDEVEAALDDTNIGRFVELLRRYADRAQFVVITHQKRTMEAADLLYGVTMGGDGVSQIVSRRLPREDAVAAAAS